MLNTPKSLRLHIALLGRVNSGKSSLLNFIIGQDTAITSDIAGTTTDVVEKAQELPPLGPVLWLDTAGFGDTGDLAGPRLQKTAEVLNRADIVLLVCDGDFIGEIENKIMDMARAKNIPLLTIFNKADIYNIKSPNGIRVNALDKHPNAREGFLGILKQAIAALCPPDSNNPPLLGDLVPEHSTVVMLVPIDYEAPKGRLILPQVQAIRDCLDHNQSVMVVKDNDYPRILDNFKTPPALVICDSQMVDYMVANTPTNIKCTTFSILMARYKGDLNAMTAGAAIIDTLQDGDKILVAEACTHHALEDDIARVKIPRWLKQKTGKNLVIDYISGCDFINNLTEYKLVIQCGGCTINRREVLSRIRRCQAAGVAITNYGVLISALKGVLPRVLEPFKD